MSVADLNRALRAARSGPEANNLTIKGHHWNVKRYHYFLGLKATNLINGQISHCLSGRPDDQIYYTIKLYDDKEKRKMIRTIEVKINKGGWAPFIGVVGSGVAAYFGVPIPSDQIEKVSRVLAEAIEGDGWQSVARFLVARIAIEIPANY